MATLPPAATSVCAALLIVAVLWQNVFKDGS